MLAATNVNSPFQFFDFAPYFHFITSPGRSAPVGAKLFVLQLGDIFRLRQTSWESGQLVIKVKNNYAEILDRIKEKIMQRFLQPNQGVTI